MNVIARRTILVAEDNEISRDLLVHQLRMLRREAVAVEDGSQAIRAWREGDFSLLMTDLEMPGLNGYELACLIRSESVRADAPIILVTAGAGAADSPHHAAAAISDILSKPASLAALRGMLERWLGPAAPAEPESAPRP